MNRPRPVLTSAGIAGAVTSVAGVLTFLGYDTASAHLSAMTSTITAVAIGIVGLASHLLAALHSQSKVTPKDSPQADDGTPLVRADVAAADVAAAAAVPVDTSPIVVEPIVDDPAPVEPAAEPVTPTIQGA